MEGCANNPFRIKKGHYDYLFKKALADKVEDFSLSLSN
jgi:hypothetical protein